MGFGCLLLPGSAAEAAQHGPAAPDGQAPNLFPRLELGAFNQVFNLV